jgi:peptidoglycan-associated lipoprotein
MEMLKFGKFAALALAMAVAVGCSSKGGDAAGEGAVVETLVTAQTLVPLTAP